MRMLLNIGRLGNNPGGRSEFLDNLDQADIGKARAAVEQHREWIIGMKARLSRGIARDQDKEVLRRAIEVAGSFDLPVMIHIGDTASTLPELLQMLRPGDIVTHMCAPNPNGILDDKGMVLPQVREARERGIRFDFANGLHEHWTWAVAEAALAQGFPPDTLTSDLTVAGRKEQVYDLPTVVSKWMHLGMPLNDALACVTSHAAATFRELKPYGSLTVGAAADVTVLELTEGEFPFLDNYEGSRTAKQKLVTRGVVAGGKVV
jgi:dihydroorotase